MNVIETALREELANSRAELWKLAVYCFTRYGHDAYLYNSLADLAGVPIALTKCPGCGAETAGVNHMCVSRGNEPSVSVSTVEGITVAGARAFWRWKDEAAAHERLRAAVMTIYSDPHLTWEQARIALAQALTTDHNESDAADTLRATSSDCRECGFPLVCVACEVKEDTQPAWRHSAFPTHGQVLEVIASTHPTTEETLVSHFSLPTERPSAWMSLDWRDRLRHIVAVIAELRAAGLITVTVDTSSRGRLRLITPAVTGGETAALRAERDRLREAAAAFVAKLDECQPHIDAMFGLSFVRTQRQYTGPNYGAELATLRALLTPTPTPEG